ncbi:MAG: R53.5-related protein [Monoraphidium minutum]|nr:MAG: R53.5-related protein [Monoraphidium minutum]
MAQPRLPALASLAAATLKTLTGEELRAASLWASSPVLVFAVRRPGCVLCRDTAKQFWAANEQFAAAGVKLVCVVHEWIDREIAAFHTPEYWPGDIYFDADKAFYKAFSEDGQSVRTQSALSLLNPFNAAWGRIRAANGRVAESNVAGDGTVLGGLLLLKAGEGGAAYMHAERSFGEFPPVEEVVAAVKTALA